MTAEEVRNRYGSRYTYYHCTKRRLDYQCHQKAVQLAVFEEQIQGFLGELKVPSRFLPQLGRLLAKSVAAHQKTKQEIERSLVARAETLGRELQNLRKLRVRDLITDEEYLRDRREMEQEQVRVGQELAARRKRQERFQLSEILVSFNQAAAECFTDGSPEAQRFVLTLCGSNFLLKDQEARIDAAIPFRRWTAQSTISELRAFVEDVQTFVSDPRQKENLAKMEALIKDSSSSAEAQDDNRAARGNSKSLAPIIVIDP